MGKLRDQMLVELQLRGATPGTQKTYLREAENLAKYFNKSPEELGEDELKEYMLYLMKERHLSEGTLRFYVAALKFLNNVKIVLIDPRRTKWERWANFWLRPFPGSDIAWINGLTRFLIENDVHSKEFIETKTEGFETMRSSFTEFSPEFVQEATGIPSGDLKAVVAIAVVLWLLSVFWTSQVPLQDPRGKVTILVQRVWGIVATAPLSPIPAQGPAGGCSFLLKQGGCPARIEANLPEGEMRGVRGENL